MSLTKKLIISFVFSTAIAIIITSMISNTMINRKFENYLIEEQEKRIEKIKEIIDTAYKEHGDTLSQENISKVASIEDLYIEVRDEKENLICSSNQNTMKHQRGMMRRHHMMHNTDLNTTGEYVEKKFPLYIEDKYRGELIIGYYDNSHITESALLFKNTLSKSFIISGVVAIILGFFISIFLSKELSNPLLNITNTANHITKGNLDTRSNILSNTKEIDELSQSINFLAETLQNQEDLRKKYASNIAHELRTPLSTLQAHVEALIDGIWEPSEEHLIILLDEINRLSGLVNELKDSFKIEEGHLNLNKTYFNLSEEMEKVIETFNPLYKKSNFLLKYSIEKNIFATMDKNKIKQIMYNLLSNSMKYLKDEGKVFVSLKTVKNKITIDIVDNGIGISEDELPYIFERFYRSNNFKNNKINGSGLGLTITKALVEAHNGSIEVESKLGLGTKFTIVFPT